MYFFVTVSALDLEDSEGSLSDNEGDVDAQSTTSFEELSKLHPDLLLYKAAQVYTMLNMFVEHGCNTNKALFFDHAILYFPLIVYVSIVIGMLTA